MSSNKRIARNLMVSVFGEGFGALINIYIIVLIARQLGPEIFGEFSFILAFVGLLQLITDMGIANLLIREISLKREDFAKIMGNVRVLAWVLTSVVLVVTAIICLLVLEDKTFGLNLLVMTFAAMVTLHIVTYGALFRAFERMEFTSAFFVIHKIILLSLVYYWINSDPSLFRLCTFYLIANCCQFLMLYVSSIIVFQRIKWLVDLSFWRYLIVEAVPVGLSMLLRKTTLHVDTILLSVLASPIALGLFSAAYRIIQIVEMLPFTFSIPMYPKLTRLANQDRNEFVFFLNQVLKFYILVALPMMAYLFVFADQIVGLMYTEEYRQSAAILQALSIAVFFIFPSSIMVYVYTALNRQRLFTVISAALLLTNATLDFILIPIYGAFGAAMGTIAAEALFIVTSVIFLKQHSIHVKLVRLSYKPLLSAVVAGLGVTYLLSFDGVVQLIVGSLFFGAVYLLAVVVTKALNADEISFMLDLVKRKNAGGRASK